MSNSAKHLVNTWKWQALPYRKDSDPSQIKSASIPKWSRPATNNDPTKTKYIDYSNPPASGDCTSRRPIQARGLKSPNWWPKAKPIKHWRKQLIPNQPVNSRRVSVRQAIDTPGGTTRLDAKIPLNNNPICKEDVNHIPNYVKNND